MALGGVFYYNLFRWTFEEKLKQDMIEMVRIKSPDLIKGILRQKQYPTIEEGDVMNWLGGDKRIADILYLNGNGFIRWHKQGQLIGIHYEEYVKQVGVETDAIDQAYQSGQPKVRSFKKDPFFDIAIPLKAKGEVVIGILNLQVSKESSSKIIGSAMNKYVLGAIGVLILLGLPLWIYLRFFIVAPIISLRDCIDSISTKSFDIKFAARKDEIGEQADAIGGLLGKVRLELDAVTDRERQRQSDEELWWKAVLSTAVADGSQAIVVDEDNNVLFANFDLDLDRPDQKKHLLDIIDSQQQDVLRIIGMAMDTPRQIMQNDVMFKGIECRVRAIQVQAEGNIKRTLVLFTPLKRLAQQV
jgi:HAMP domain-containing protein